MLFRLLLLLLLAAPLAPAAAYSVLTHQAVIDSTWERALLPQLRRHYPGGTADELETAKSYAYGGSILQDMGYYPLGSKLFTNLTHYVRSGDFVANLLRLARDRNEYAFALGALAHYAADNVGHPEGTNQIMPTVYPDLKAQFGPVVTYEQATKRHTELEFSFDVVQVAAGRYRSQEYHKFIGFQVNKTVLERAFLATYGLELGQVVVNVDASVATFRFAVNQLLPATARAAWQSQRKEIRKMSPQARRRDYRYKASPGAFRKEFGSGYERPGFGARAMAFVINLLPKIGPLKTYAFKLPDAAGEAKFRASYRAVLAQFVLLARQQPADTASAHTLPDTNLDTGQPTRPATYALADQTYNELLRELNKHQFEHLTPALRQALLAYYIKGIPTPARETEHGDPKTERQVEKKRPETEVALAALRALVR
ncbi:MAG: zinc dependent phospholipase C family protein [Bacteroidota bacterium]|nr:zinc dependent phospholipase C family protein [Bacteroidota bacterium]